jgi:hypothetical protein
MKKKLTPEQEALLKKFSTNNNQNSVDKSDNKNEKASTNAPKPKIRRSGSRGK